MKITNEQIAELKGKYTKLYKVTRRENDYIFRLPTFKEWKEARRKDSTFSTNDKLVSTCLVFPTLQEMRSDEKSDAVLVEVLGRKLITYLMEDEQDGDTDGQKILFEDGSSGFKISRRGRSLKFRSPTRAEWKRISSLIGSDNFTALEYLVEQCKLDITDSELMGLVESDVVFIELVGGPFIKMVAEDLMDAEGKEIS
ncbi:MAG: hypothetical protein EKK57_11185 [Proteobacteria bacterium]|nr:MAG: hypothetical protein EKK57_11185 [Pseudomonadota bacterium]